VRYHLGMEEEPVLTARALLEWRCRELHTSLPRLPEAAVLTHQTSLLGRRWPWQRDRSLRCFTFDTRPLDAALTLAGCRGIGGPGTAAAIEEMAAVGVRRIVTVDVCGSLDNSLRSSDVLLVTSAISTGAIIQPYSEASSVSPSPRLTERLRTALAASGLPYTAGAVWSTDAVYREIPSLLQSARQRGAIAADMETAATLATAAALGIEAATVLVAADELFEGWQPPRDMAAVRARMRGLLTIATAGLRS
jgi:uridine phosphorylase